MVLGPTGDIGSVIELRDSAAKNGSGRLISAHIRGRDSSGGYGDPLARDPARVLIDVLDGYESIGKARDVYGVIFSGKIEDATLAVDTAATAARRAELGRAAPLNVEHRCYS